MPRASQRLCGEEAVEDFSFPGFQYGILDLVIMRTTFFLNSDGLHPVREASHCMSTDLQLPAR